MVFGEIVEPSTRALIDEVYEEYPEYIKPELIWQGDVTVPPNLNMLLFIEGNKITTFFNALVLNDDMIQCSLKTGDIKIYKVTHRDFIVSYTKHTLTTGEIIEELIEWLKKANHIYTLMSDSISTYQNPDLTEKPETLIRLLSTENDSFIFNHKKLESPNLVSGLGADVLSFAIHTRLKATLFVIYMNNTPLDSVNVNPILQLCNLMKLPVKTAPPNLNPTPSNLYL